MSVAIATPILRLTTGPLAGKVIEVDSTLRLGRHPFNEVSLSDPALSRYHCWIMPRAEGLTIEDLASANGTYVNGERVRARVPLKTGDVIRVGSTEMRVSLEE